ncbi:MAG: T9SS type A sorting domain-containing protein [Melioribacteraceae bacterium]|nr:T9SS type A sorting domain-containing protein [Melioribacteraceae bacterium]
MFEGALVYGTSPKKVVGAARDLNAEKDNDFSVIVPISLHSPGTLADNETYAKFSDEEASPASLGIETEVNTYSFSDELNDDYMFIRYTFTNTTSELINNFYAGQYWDFDMDGGSYEDDMVAFDIENNFGYAFDDDGDPVATHVGLALLSNGNTNFFAMDNTGESNPTISWDGFSDSEKWIALTSGMEYTESGPNDISLLISTGPFTISPNSTAIIDFLIAAGDNLEDLRNNVIQARVKYQDILTNIGENGLIIQDFTLEQNYPNPFNPTTKIKYSIPTASAEFYSELQNVNLTVYDVLGRKVTTLVNQKQRPGKYEVVFDASRNRVASGVYYYQLISGDYISTKKMLLLK